MFAAPGANTIRWPTTTRCAGSMRSATVIAAMSAHCDGGPPPAAARNSASEPAITTEMSRDQSTPQNASTFSIAVRISDAIWASRRSAAGPPGPIRRTWRSPTIRGARAATGRL